MIAPTVTSLGVGASGLLVVGVSPAGLPPCVFGFPAGGAGGLFPGLVFWFLPGGLLFSGAGPAGGVGVLFALLAPKSGGEEGTNTGIMVCLWVGSCPAGLTPRETS
jgi:hypothetical protein